MDKWFGAKRRDFSQAFRSTEQSKARQDFRWGLEAAYRKHSVQAKPGELAELIRRIEWPSQFPPTGDLVEYVGHLNWVNEQGESFWSFIDQLFEPTITPSTSKLLTEQQFKEFFEARRTSAKFRDDWSKQIQDQLIIAKDVKEAV